MSCPSIVPRSQWGVFQASAPSAGTTLIAGPGTAWSFWTGVGVRIAIVFSSNTTAVAVPSGWISLYDSGAIASTGRLSIFACAYDGVTTQGFITVPTNWGTAGCIYKSFDILGLDISNLLGGVAVGVSTGNSNSMTAPGTAAVTYDSHVVHCMIASGTAAPTPGTPTGTVVNAVTGSTTFGTDYGYALVNSHQVAAGGTPASCSASLSGTFRWVGVSLALKRLDNARPLVMASSSSWTAFSGSVGPQRPELFCAAETGGALTNTGQLVAGDIVVVFLAENNNGNFTSTPPNADWHYFTGSLVTGGVDVAAGVAFYYVHPGGTSVSVTFSASSINWGLGYWAFHIHGASIDGDTPFALSEAGANATNMTCPTVTCLENNSVGLTWAVCNGGVSRAPSFTPADAVTDNRQVNQLGSANGPPQHYNHQMGVAFLDVDKGSFAPTPCVMTTNNPAAYIGYTLIINSPQRALNAAGRFQGVATPRASFRIRRWRKPRRTQVWHKGLDGTRKGVVT